jgi:large subunit ribosomal protein L12
MEYVYALLLLYIAGKEINEFNLISVIKAAGIEVNKEQMEAIVSNIKNINIENLLAAAIGKTPSEKSSKPVESHSSNQKPPRPPGAGSQAVETSTIPVNPSSVIPVCVECYLKYGNPYICLCKKDKAKAPTTHPERI